MRITKGTLIDLIRQKAELTYTKAEIDDVYTSICEVISEQMAEGNEISLIDVGTFSLCARSARLGRNPHTGETIDIPEKVQPKFRFASTLKSAIHKLDPDQFRKEPKEAKSVRKNNRQPDKPKQGRRTSK